nr:hypothetical protein [Tanacetum cinerariifolium]
MDHIYTDENVADLLTKPFDAGRFQYLVYKLLPLLRKLSTVSVFLGFGLTFAGTSKYWGVLRILMIGLRLIHCNLIMARLLFCGYHNMVAILEKGEHNTDFHPMVDFLEASPLRTVPLFAAMLVHQGEGSGTPTKPHPTPSLEAQTPLHTTHPSSSLPPIITTSISTVTPSETTPIRQIYQEKYDCLVLYQDRATIDKSSTLPYDSAPWVTSPAAVEGSMQQTIPELTALCTSLQRQLSELTDKFQTQEVEINRLKERVKRLEEREGVVAINSRGDAPIKGRTTVLASRVVDVPTGSGSIPTVSTPAEGSVPTGREEVPTASPVFATATVVTPVTRRKDKEVMVESETPKKQKVQEQIDAQVARDLEEQLARKDQRRAEQIAKDAKIARIHAEEELQSMIDGLDSNNETVAKYLEEYRQFSSELPMERRIELISDLVHLEGQRSYWKITRLGGSSACYQEDLNQLWRLVKETLSTRPPTSDKEIELWVELSRLYEPDKEDQSQRQRNLYACGEGLPSEEGSSTCDDLL